MLSVASATVGSLTGVLLRLFGRRLNTDQRLRHTDKTADGRQQYPLGLKRDTDDARQRLAAFGKWCRPW